MASPFSVFRKQQKVWMAVLTVMAMFAFIFGSAQCDNSPAGGRANSVVASTQFVDLRESDLAGMRETRIEVNRFFNELTNAVVSKVFDGNAFGSQFGPEFKQRFMFSQLQQMSQGIRNRLMDAGIGDQSLVDTVILARRADEMGIVISDGAITEFIKEVSNNQISTEELRGIIKRCKLSDRGLYDAIRQMMLAANVQRMMAGGFGEFPPAENWEYYQQLKRRVVCEVIPVSVSDFTAQVKDPAEDVLRKFFDENKAKVKQPLRPEPGFKQPDLAAFQYLKADYDRFVDEKSITDKEIEEHYEKFKGTRYQYTRPAPKSEPAASEPTSEDETDKTPAAPESAKPDTGTPAEPPKPEGTKAEEPKSEPKSCTPADDEAAVCQDPVKSEEPAKPAGEPELKPAGDETKPGETPPAAKTSSGPSINELMIELALPRNIMDGPDPQYDPLWKVEGRIRTELARQKGAEKMSEVLNDIRSKALDKYFEDFAQWKAVDVVGGDFPKPTRPDFPALAAANNLTAHETSMLSVYDFVTETDLGAACNRDQSADAAFRSNPLFKAGTTQDDQGNQYLYWKIEFSAERELNFEDPAVRESVLAAWKEIEARSLAKKRAEELVAKATAEKAKPLAEIFQGQADVKVERIGPFTWITEGFRSTEGQAPPRLTTVEGVEFAGNDFMKAVFSTAEGESTVAFNQPETVVYAIRVDSYQPLPAVLQQTFLVENASQVNNYMYMARADAFEAQTKWLEQVRTAAGLHWTRDPYQENLR